MRYCLPLYIIFNNLKNRIMIFTEIYLSLIWHVLLCAIAIILSTISKEWWVIIIVAIYFFLAPYGKEEKTRNCQTENGNTVSVIVEFKEPIIKLLWTKPADVMITAINGQKCKVKLREDSNKKVYNGTVFEGYFSDNGKSNTLLLIL